MDGGFGADSMSGGTGDDVYFVDDAGDKISDSGGLDSSAAPSTMSLRRNWRIWFS